MKDVYIKVGNRTPVLLKALLKDRCEIPNPISFVNRDACMVDSDNLGRILSRSVFETTISILFLFFFHFW